MRVHCAHGGYQNNTKFRVMRARTFCDKKQIPRVCSRHQRDFPPPCVRVLFYRFVFPTSFAQQREMFDGVLRYSVV